MISKVLLSLVFIRLDFRIFLKEIRKQIIVDHSGAFMSRSFHKLFCQHCEVQDVRIVLADRSDTLLHSVRVVNLLDGCEIGLREFNRSGSNHGKNGLKENVAGMKVFTENFFCQISPPVVIAMTN